MRFAKELLTASLFVMLVSLVACSGSDELDADTQQPDQKTWTVSMVATGEGISDVVDAAQTRAIYYGGNNGHRFSFIWDEGEEVSVFKGDTKLGTLTPTVFGMESTTLTGTLTGAISAGDELTVYLGGRNYNYTGQDGTLSKLSSDRAYQQATVTVKAEDISGSTLSLPVTKLTHAQTYLRLRLSDEAGNRLHPTKLQVFAASGRMIKGRTAGGATQYFTTENPLTITPAAENGEYPDELFFCINTDNDASDTYTFKAWVGEDIYEGPVAPLTANLYSLKGKLANVVRTMTCTYQKPGAARTPGNAMAVDLGLPSGTKWANMNIGATKVTDYGTYFAWGETSGYSVVGSSTTPAAGNAFNIFSQTRYSWTNGDISHITKYCPEDQTERWGLNTTPDNILQIQLGDDAARANWGGNWRMPTKEEMEELINETDNESFSGYIDGVYVSAWKFMNKSDHSKYIYLIGAGYSGNLGFKLVGSCYYWTSTLYPTSPWYAYHLKYSGGVVSVAYDQPRYAGLPIRAVQ